MSFDPTPAELLSRARADLRMGLPIVLRHGSEALLAAAAETISAERLAELAPEAHLALTQRRAETLKIPVYDGDLARIALPRGLDLAGLHAIIDPADDLMAPLKGPFQALRGGETALARAALTLLKSARLLPAALIAPAESAGRKLTTIDADMLSDNAPSLARIISARLPLPPERPGCTCSAPTMAATNTMRSKSAAPTAMPLCWCACILPVSPATCWGR